MRFLFGASAISDALASNLWVLVLPLVTAWLSVAGVTTLCILQDQSHIRGQLSQLYQPAITVGILLGYMQPHFAASVNWRWMVALPEPIPAVILLPWHCLLARKLSLVTAHKQTKTLKKS